MGIELKWWEDPPILEYLCTGQVPGSELVERNREAITDPRFPALRGQLCDMRAVDSFEITPDQIRVIVEMDLRAADLAPDCSRVAIVATEDLIFGFARMYEMTLDGRVPGWEVNVVRSRPQAVAWLGVEDRWSAGS